MRAAKFASSKLHGVKLQRTFATGSSPLLPSDRSLAAERSDGLQQLQVESAEVQKFSQLAEDWWNPTGPFRPLHQLNPVRCKFIRAALCDQYRLNPAASRPLTDVTILDVGCGGGLLSESLARMGARVTGIDLSAASIDLARAHATMDPQIAKSVTYQAISTDGLAQQGRSFDVVIASEVIEHVDHPPAFCRSLADLTASSGTVILSTINRTVRAYALAIVAAERVLGILPRDTHDWSKFITPGQPPSRFRQGGTPYASGMSLDVASGRWGLSEDLAVNYIACFRAAARHAQASQPS
ncbi:hypothetical protein WJX84_002414 [Apatococcus fuscideae]|uniref:Ubiquinone biosynthesis O-methyltransferase, mitochondrial n=1 Tax=Apatococcus fuscideae TaxID=2026836 RepID=A0AAW1SVT3_9CHLO